MERLGDLVPAFKYRSSVLPFSNPNGSRVLTDGSYVLKTLSFYIYKRSSNLSGE